jgi:hypothetical protein
VEGMTKMYQGYRVNIILVLSLFYFTPGCQKKDLVSIDNRGDDGGLELSSDLSVGNYGLTREQAIIEVAARKEAIIQRHELLQRERDRQGKLTAELLSDSKNGCWADKKIEQMEILITGAHMDRLFRYDANSSHAGSSGTPWTYTFRFGPNIAVINDEQSNAMFIAGGKKIVTDLNTHKISDLEYLKISKGGTKLDSEKRCKKSGGLFGGQKCRHHHYEETRTQLDEIEIRVNGETLYKRTAMATPFQDGRLEWAEEAFKANERYLELMNRTDCDQ